MSEDLLPVPPATPPQQLAESWSEPAGVAPAPHKPPFERQIAVIRRFKYLIAGVLILAAAGGFVATRLVTPQYEVRATIWIESATPLQEKSGPIRSHELLSDMAWVELLKSYRISDAVVRKLSLYIKPENRKDAYLFSDFDLADRFVPGTYVFEIDKKNKRWTLTHQTVSFADHGGATDSVGRKMGFRWTLPPAAFSAATDDKVRFTVSTPRETAVALTEQLGTRLAEKSNFLWLSYQDPDPQLAAKTLNTWVNEYVSVAGELKKKNLVEYSKILTGQLQFAEKSLHDAEASLESFRIQTITLPAEGGPVTPGIQETRAPALNAFFEKKIEYDNLKHDTEDLESTISSAKNNGTPYEAALLIPSVAQSPGAEALRQAFKDLYKQQADLTAARQVYTDQYLPVRDLIKAVDTLKLQTIPNLANLLLTQLKRRQTEFDVRITGNAQELKAIPSRTIEEMRLRRAVVVAEELYTTLKSRTAEAQLAEAGAQPDVNILDSAIAPLRPTKNTTPRIMLIALLGGLGAAIGLALLLDLMDGRIRYAEQATNELGLVVAGAVPRIPKGGIDGRSPEQVSQLIEAFRTLRMHVLQAGPLPTSVAVSSPSPADGKSLISANLAMSFADAGFRTVLVDGDTRRGALDDMFGLTQRPGLTEYLAGSADLAAIVRQTTHDRLSIVPCGTRQSRSPELLTSPRLAQLLKALRASHDVVIVDTPPLAAGIDAYAISAAAGRMLMVLRVGQTERRMAAAKLAVADRLPIDIIGAVLNGVGSGGEYYYYSYAGGYSVSDGSENGDGDSTKQIPETVGS